MSSRTISDLSEEEMNILAAGSKLLFLKMDNLTNEFIEKYSKKDLPIDILINAISVSIESLAHRHFIFLLSNKKIPIEKSLKAFCEHVRMYDEMYEKKHEYVKSLTDY